MLDCSIILDLRLDERVRVLNLLQTDGTLELARLRLSDNLCGALRHSKHLISIILKLSDVLFELVDVKCHPLLTLNRLEAGEASFKPAIEWTSLTRKMHTEKEHTEHNEALETQGNIVECHESLGAVLAGSRVKGDLHDEKQHTYCINQVSQSENSLISRCDSQHKASTHIHLI